MADALISPTVGGTLWAASSGAIAWCAKKVKATRDDRLIPLMGVLGAFIFTAQMVNFSVPGTGSSGHLVGGLILAILLGPHAAFLVIASVLTVQSLFFADGGLLALGCNIFNMGVFPIFIGYPLIYRPLASGGGESRRWIAALLAAIIAMQLGALGVVLETKASGVSALPSKTFLLLMQPIHLAIGVVEGLATAVIVGFVSSVRPEVLASNPGMASNGKEWRSVCLGVLAAAILIGGIVSCYASKRPDGLEWAIAKLTGRPQLQSGADPVHDRMARLQENTAILPDYQFQSAGSGSSAALSAGKSGTSFSGILGGLITLVICGLIGFTLKSRRREA